MLYNINNIPNSVFIDANQLSKDLPECRSSSNRVLLDSRPDPKIPIPLRTTARKHPSGNEVYPS